MDYTAASSMPVVTTDGEKVGGRSSVTDQDDELYSSQGPGVATAEQPMQNEGHEVVVTDGWERPYEGD